MIYKITLYKLPNIAMEYKNGIAIWNANKSYHSFTKIKRNITKMNYLYEICNYYLMSAQLLVYTRYSQFPLSYIHMHVPTRILLVYRILLHKRSTNAPQTLHKRSTNAHERSTNAPQTLHKRSTIAPQTAHLPAHITSIPIQNTVLLVFLYWIQGNTNIVTGYARPPMPSPYYTCTSTYRRSKYRMLLNSTKNVWWLVVYLIFAIYISRIFDCRELINLPMTHRR